MMNQTTIVRLPQRFFTLFLVLLFLVETLAKLFFRVCSSNRLYSCSSPKSEKFSGNSLDLRPVSPAANLRSKYFSRN